jgi:hypothetical protein
MWCRQHPVTLFHLERDCVGPVAADLVAAA